MQKYIFFGGVHPPTYKTVTRDRPIKRASLPKKVILPLYRQIGKSSRPIVKIGDYVEVGTKIAQAEGFISNNMHSPVSGRVIAIEPAYHPILGKSPSIIIESDFKKKELDNFCFHDGQFNIDKLSQEKIVEAIREAGIVGMGGACFPTHVKLSPPKDKKIDILIINGAECEPYLTCDHRLMLERPGDIIKGAIIMAKALRVERIIIGIEDNKLDGIIAMRDVARVVIARDDEAISEQGDCFASLRSARNDVFRVVSLPTKYPQGAEKQLIKTLTGKEVPSGGLPFDVGVVVHNVATAQAVYEAVVLNKPFFERVITVSGDCVKDPGNLLVKIGTPVKDLINDCGGFVKEPLKVIFGGPMMGFAQWALDVPVLEGTSGVLFLSIDAISQDPAGVCIRCGGCVRLCPMGLSPTSIYYAAVNNKFDLANEYNALDCVECGACSWECPAKLDLVGMIKYAKLRIRK